MCNSISRQIIILSRKQNQCCDLDSKPSNKFIETFQFEIQVCPSCGYANFNIEEKVSEDYIISDDYKTYFDKIKNLDVIEKHLLCLKTYENTDEYYIIALLNLKLSWIYEDMYLFNQAKQHRSSAIEYFNKLPIYTTDSEIYMIYIDLLRKNSLFEECINSINKANNFESESQKFINFVELEKELVEKKDCSTHNYKEVLERMEVVY